MKKVYTLLAASALVLGASAQNMKVANELTSAPVDQATASRAIIWEEDFESGTFPPTGWTNVSNGTTTHADQTWHEYGTTNKLAGILFNIDTTNKTSDEVLTTGPIDLTGETGKIRYKFAFNGSTYWYVTPNNIMDFICSVSKDGGSTWTKIWQEDDQALNEASRTWPWATSEWIYPLIDISAYVGETIQIRWEAVGTWPVWFYLDNFVIENTPDNDHRLLGAYTGDIYNAWDYSISPLNQTPSPMVAAAQIKDNGDQPMSGQISIDVIDGSGSSVWNGDFPYDFGTTGATQYDSIFVFTTGFTPAGEGDYTFEFALKTDDDYSNNDKSTSITINNAIYAHDFEGNYTPMNIYYSQANNPTAEVAMGNRFEIFANTTIYGVDVQFGEGTDNGAVIEVFVSSMDDPTTVQGGLTPVGSGFYTINATNDIDNFVTIPLDAATNLVAGTHYVVEIRKGAGTEVVFLNANSADDDNAAVFYGPYGKDGAINYFIGLGRTPAVRMNLDPAALSIADLTENGVTLGQNIPNPATSTTKVNYSLETATTVSFDIIDITGKTVMTINEGNRVAGEHNVVINTAALAKGVYYYTLTANANKLTKKMVIAN